MAQQGSADIRVSVPNDGSVAELCIPTRFDPESVNLELVIALLQQAGVAINQEVKDAAGTALANAAPDIESRIVVARIRKPVHGTDGWIEWLLPDMQEKSADEPEETKGTSSADQGDPDASDDADHYARSAFVMVEAGTPLARVHPPTLGEDGVDVRGRTLAAKQGKPAPLKIDESLSINSSGIVTAEVNGAVLRTGNTLTIRNFLDIEESVDFSTGNIQFEGSVRIRREIKDLFVVECDGAIEVGGLIQAATIRCGGDLIARGGMAGRERGQIVCGGSISGRYFDATKIEASGDLSFDRELINCETTINGKIDSPRGSIIGGKFAVAGSVCVGNLGSKGGANTRISLGAVPRLQRRLEMINRLIEEVESRVDDGAAELRRLSEPGRKLSADQIERQTELIFYEQTAKKQRSRLLEAREKVEARITELSVVDVCVERMLYHGVRVIVGETECRITKDTRGPLRITRARDGVPMYQAGSDANLRKLAELGQTRLIQQAA